ncbi:hypothetical protein N7493_006219 [Penicillium malachiteum]|uniref:Uncharacterized protein n=1 Tax=Penicillium malachiteum TaxID=1324776 RepID=A0AAD6HK82_9EURO|nr:hypothetical protein N7493_006219 [Penicillium malachiteum]
MLRAKDLVVSPGLAAEVFHGAVELQAELPMSMTHRVAIIKEWLLNAGPDIYYRTEDDLDLPPGHHHFYFAESLGGLTRWEHVKQKLKEMIPEVSNGTKELIELKCLKWMKEIEDLYE